MLDILRRLQSVRVALASIAVALATTGGTFTEYSIPTPHSGPLSITAGPDGALWFTEQLGFKIGRHCYVGANHRNTHCRRSCASRR